MISLFSSAEFRLSANLKTSDHHLMPKKALRESLLTLQLFRFRMENKFQFVR